MTRPFTSSLGPLAAVFVLASLAMPAGQAQQTAATVVLYEGARVVPGDGSPAIENAAFVVQNGRFTRVGRRGDVPLPAGGDVRKSSRTA